MEAERKESRENKTNNKRWKRVENRIRRWREENRKKGHILEQNLKL